MEKTAYYNIQFNNLDTGETLTQCELYYDSEPCQLIFFINAHCFNIAQDNQAYKNALNDADLLLNDGIGFKLGAKFKGIQIKENMNGTDFIPKLCRQARDLGKNIYLLGGEEGIAIQAKLNLERTFSGISIVGARNGFFDFDRDEELVKEITDCKTDLLIVGMGVPRQELWLMKNKEKLRGVKISVAGGAVLDFISGNVPRAPVWMQKTGTEWVFRLYNEPKRLFKRYFIGIPVFFINLTKVKSS
jgi:N-acetylglucosaminyldiphosphoundecaprenol N-acetyl-beta-D-mannosaminyltransferase